MNSSCPGPGPGGCELFYGGGLAGTPYGPGGQGSYFFDNTGGSNYALYCYNTGSCAGTGTVPANGGQGLMNPDGTYPYTTIGSTTPYGCDGATVCVSATPITDTYCAMSQCAPDTGNPYVFTGNPYVTAGTDIVGIIAAVGGHAKLGYANAGLSLWNDPSTQNFLITGAGLVPELNFPTALFSAETDLLTWEVMTIGEGMIETIPAATMVDESGVQYTNPAEMDVCVALGATCH